MHLEAIVAKKGKINGILIQGIEMNSVDSVLNLRSRVVEGKFDLERVKGVDSALVGKELARRLDLKVGDDLQIVMPKPSKVDATAFSPARAHFRISGLLDLGKYEFNERLVIVSQTAGPNPRRYRQRLFWVCGCA